MTREEAISKVKGYLTDYLSSDDYEEVEEIIEAIEQESCEMSVEEYRLRMIQALHNADCDELIVVCVMPTEKEFEHLEWWLKNNYKKESCEDWHDVPSDKMTLEQARQAVKDLRKKLAEYLWQEPCEDNKQKLIKDCQPPTDDWEQYADKLHDIAYKHGYEQAQKDLTCEDAKGEIWKDIPEFEGIYEASNMGRIRSVSRIVRSGKGNRINPTVILKPSIGQWGYEQVCLRKDGKKYTKRVNRLVAQAFIPNQNNLPQVNHIDGDKTNNCVDNLEWCDASHNMKHCFYNQMSGWTTKIKIIETGEVFNSKAECARKIGGHISLIDMCLKGKRKTHKGYHFEIIGERASDKYNRKNVINKKDNYESELKIEYKGEIHSFREWSMITGIKQHTLYTRYNRGDREDRLFRPIQLERRKDKNGKYIK